MWIRWYNHDKKVDKGLSDMKTSFTAEEIERLKQSPYILNVTEKQIIYGDIFHQEFWRLYQRGFKTSEIFRILGLDPDIVGSERMKAAAYNIKKRAEKGELFNGDAKEPLSIAEQLKEQARQIEYLKQENEFLKKKRLIDMEFKK